MKAFFISRVLSFDEARFNVNEAVSKNFHF
jgi:hypothetical protein